MAWCGGSSILPAFALLPHLYLPWAFVHQRQKFLFTIAVGFITIVIANSATPCMAFMLFAYFQTSIPSSFNIYPCHLIHISDLPDAIDGLLQLIR